MIIFDDVTKENKKSIIQIDHKFLMIHTEYQQAFKALDLEKKKSIFNVINKQLDIDLIYLDPYEATIFN